MSNPKYYYNRQTLQFEEHRVSVKTKLFRTISVFCSILLAATVMYLLADELLPSQKEKALMAEIAQMKYHYEHLNAQIDAMSDQLSDVQERDAQVHRFVFGMEPIDPTVWQAGVGGHDKYSDLLEYPNAGKILDETYTTIDQLERQIKIQEASLKDIETQALQRAEMFDAIPSIKPVRVDLLKRNVTLLSGFGMRMHPVHKIRKMHEGIDFTAPRGTAIQATGAGTVTSVRKSKTGFGRHVVIDHGYGYTTLYAHMQDIIVKVGDKVKKGQKLGTVGSTGTSTAPHCHYEVHRDGRPVDPIHYCLDGLTPEEYKAVVARASAAGQSFD